MTVFGKTVFVLAVILVALSVVAGVSYGVGFGAAAALLFVAAAERDEAMYVAAFDKPRSKGMHLTANAMLIVGVLLFAMSVYAAPTAAAVAASWTVIGVLSGVYVADNIGRWL